MHQCADCLSTCWGFGVHVVPPILYHSVQCRLLYIRHFSLSIVDQTIIVEQVHRPQEQLNHSYVEKRVFTAAWFDVMSTIYRHINLAAIVVCHPNSKFVYEKRQCCWTDPWRIPETLKGCPMYSPSCVSVRLCLCLCTRATITVFELGV